MKTTDTIEHSLEVENGFRNIVGRVLGAILSIPLGIVMFIVLSSIYFTVYKFDTLRKVFTKKTKTEVGYLIDDIADWFFDLIYGIVS